MCALRREEEEEEERVVADRLVFPQFGAESSECTDGRTDEGTNADEKNDGRRRIIDNVVVSKLLNMVRPGEQPAICNPIASSPLSSTQQRLKELTASSFVFGHGEK